MHAEPLMRGHHEANDPRVVGIAVDGFQHVAERAFVHEGIEPAPGLGAGILSDQAAPSLLGDLAAVDGFIAPQVAEVVAAGDRHPAAIGCRGGSSSVVNAHGRNFRVHLCWSGPGLGSIRRVSQP